MSVAMARRPLALACLFLAAAPLPSAFGQATLLEGLQDGDNINLDTMLDELAERGVAEGGSGSSSSSSSSPEVQGKTVKDEEREEEEEDIDDIVVEPDEPREQSTSADDADGGGGDVEGSSGGGGGDGFFKAKMSKKPKKGNKICGWSWRERRCQPAPLCEYKYQFLDATLSESCRRKDFTVSREVFETSDIRVQPAVALAGAVGLFAGDLLAIRYTDLLQKFPMLFNVVQGFVLFVSGDTLFQLLEQGWKRMVGIRFWRMIRSGIIGALNNGLVHYSYYKWIDKRFPYDKFTEKRWGPADGALSKLAVGFTKWAIEWPTIGVYKIASMYILTALMSGSLDGLLERMEDSLFLTWLRSLQVWPIYDMILYAYVPTAHRPLFNSFMSIAWGGYLSHVSQPHDPDTDTDEEDDVLVETS